ncbi:MAG: hypothetical protein Q4E54_05325 [Lachnospiraceae bacterium]|nr:hypothetical protein [Lachnospiraceae bacterium]
MTVFCMSGCTAGKSADSSDKLPEGMVKIADNLYEIKYTEDFDWKIAGVTDISGFACSGVQNGKYRGRNYDWTYADTDLCIVHSAVSKNRPHASVGVADISFLANDDGSYDYSRLPFVTVDGINDAGVCIQVNVMPFGENGKLNHTETPDDDLKGACVVRLVLDYADSVETALDLLKDKDILTEIDTAEELHWMISGPASKTDKTTKTVVLEIFPDGQHITSDFVDDKPIMANFNISNFDGTPASVGFGFGYERWQILNENFDQADSVIGTFDLMEKVFYTKLYDLYGERFWYSEYDGTDLSKYYDAETLKYYLGEDLYDYYMTNYNSIPYTAAFWDGDREIYGDISRTGTIAPAVKIAADNYKKQNTEDGSLWITIHTSVYDLENKTLDIQMRESQDHLHFTIN